MNLLFRRISNLFADTEGKISRLEEIKAKLEEISVIKDIMATQWQDISKAIEVSVEAKDREISYIKHIASVAKLEKSLLDELRSLESDEGVKELVNKSERQHARNIVKSLYKSGRLKLDQYNHAAGVKDEKGAVKYADVIVTNKDDEFLLLKRSIFEDNHHGAWVIPGGHVDEDEEFEEAAKRELLEESGLSVDKMCDDKVPHEFVHIGTYNDGKAHIEYYHLALFTEKYPELLLDEAETRDYRWVKRLDIDEYEMVFNMRDNVKKVMGWDNYPNVRVIRKAIEQGVIPVDKVNEIVKSYHKYIKRTGAKGNYKYEYHKEDSSNFNIEKIKDYARRVIKGEAVIERLSPEEEQGRIKGGRINVEATILLGTDARTSRDDSKDLRDRQLGVLEQYAKSTGCWVEDYLEYFGDTRIGGGTESEVFMADDCTIVKVNNFEQHEDILEMFDRIALHNFIFPEAPYKVTGFTRRDDIVNVIFEQPFVQAVNGASVEQVKEEMGKMGFRAEGSITYISDDYVVDDLHKNNVLVTDKGTLVFIDPIERLNIEGEGYGGKRKYGKIVIDDIEKSIDTDIEKAKKDKSSLKRIKKFVTREGKTFLQTFYVKSGEQEEKEIEDKYLKGVLEDVMNAEVGERYKIKTKLKEVEGLLTDIFYDHQSDSYFLITVDDSNGKLVYSKFSAIKSISKVEEQVDSGYGVGFEFVKNLGGSTGAVLVKDTKTGELWVAKRGASKEHIQSEYEALKLYRDLEVRVPDHFMKDGVLYTSFKEGYKFEELTGIAAEGFKRDLGSYFLVDCLLGNWDVVGMECDNVVYTSDGCYRVDVGGSLAYRAQGQLKSEWGEQVTEIDNMRNPEINPTAAKMFSGITDKDLYDQFQNIDFNRPAHGFLNPVVESRFQWLKKELQHRRIVSLNDSFKEIAVEQLYDVPDYLPDSIKEFYKEVDELMKVTIKDIEDCSKLTDTTTRCLLDDNVAKSELHFKEGVLNDFRKMGLSYREIFAINRFTGDSYSSINNSLVNMSNGKFGNIAFKEDGLVISNMLLENEGSGRSKTGKVNELKNELTGVLDVLAKAAKTINHHHELGDIDYNKGVMGEFWDKMEFVNTLKVENVYKGQPISDLELKAVNKLSKMFSEIGQVAGKAIKDKDLKNNKVGYIDSSLSEINDIPYYSEEVIKTKKEGKLVKEHESGLYKASHILTAKLATSGLTKIERSGNSNYLARGQTLRKITVDLEEFGKQHQYGNLVSHCRASSSKKQEENNWDGNVQMVIIGNPTVYIRSISEHPGENEALHKPFSLFECGSSFKSKYDNFTNFILRKVI